MIEAEWWDYESVDEMAEAVAGDVGFIVESALEARGEALIALPGGTTPLAAFARPRTSGIIAVGLDDVPVAAVEEDVVALHLALALVRVVVERMAGVGDLRRAVVPGDGGSSGR